MAAEQPNIIKKPLCAASLFACTNDTAMILLD